MILDAALRWQFVLGAGLPSRAIAWWGSGYNGWSHVDAILPDGSCLGARSDVIGGVKAGVQIRPPAYEKWVRRAVLKLPCTAGEAAEWETYLRSQVGDPYDKADILGLIIGRPISSAGHWICSALQTDALERVGKLPKLPLTPQQVSPNTLLAMLCAIGAQCTSS